MRTLVAIVLIVCGTGLVLAPAIAGFLDQFSATLLLTERKDLTNVTLDSAKMDGFYRLVCWAIGGLMIAVGTFGGLRVGPFSPPPPPPPPPRNLE